MNHSLRKFFSNPLPSVLATLVTCYLLFSPASMFEDGEDFLPEIFNDKVAHGILFFGLGFLWNLYNNRRLDWKIIVLGLFFFAIFTEVVQYLLPVSFGRSFDFYDILADSFGILTGVWSGWLFGQLIE